MQSGGYVVPARIPRLLDNLNITGALTRQPTRLGLAVLAGLGVGLLVIVSTYYVNNFKLVAGLIGGLAFVLLTMRWPEFGILFYVSLLSGLVNLAWVPGLRLGGASILIPDAVLLFLLGLVFLRATAQPGFALFGSPLILPLLLFICAIVLSAANAIVIYGVNKNEVLRSARMLAGWIIFIPTLQFVRDEQALRRLLIGLFIFTGVLLIGVCFPNKFAPLLPIDEVGANTGEDLYSGVTRIYSGGNVILYTMVPVMVASLAMIKQGNQLWRIVLLSLLLFWAYRTFYRQIWLTLSIICVLLFLAFNGRTRIRLLKRIAPVAIASVLLLIVLMAAQPAEVERTFYFFLDRAGSLFKDSVNSEASLQWRAIENYYALAQIGRHPILGIGLSNVYRPPMISEFGTTAYGWTFRYIENGYLYIALYMGLVGLLLFIWLSAAYLFQVIRHQHEITDDGLRAIYLGLGAGYLGMAACNVYTPFFVTQSLIFFPLAMAICEVILRVEREKRSLMRSSSVSRADHPGGSLVEQEGR